MKDYSPLPAGKKIYFASDFHLGIDLDRTSREREQLICEWLENIRSDAHAIYLVGDLFDFWFEYKTVVPRGSVRFLGKLAEISDSDIELFLFTGNHDLWSFGYLEEEIGCPVYKEPVLRTYGADRFMIGHGDGLGPGDKGYKRLKKLFGNSVAQWIFARLHPNFGIWLARYWSGRSRSGHGQNAAFSGPQNEWLIRYAERKNKSLDLDYFVFGHRHIPIDYELSNDRSRYINLGDWMQHFSYAVYDGSELELKFFTDEGQKVYP